jgi:hypothetical protein
MKATTLKQVSCAQFLARLSHDSLIDGFVRYLAVRIADQQQVIANLVTVDANNGWVRPCYSWPGAWAKKTRTASALS